MAATPDMRWTVHRHQFMLSAQPFRLPIVADAQLLRVARKPGDRATEAHLWELHRTDLVRTQDVPARWFVVRGTGDTLDGQATHVDTWIEHQFVWHLFEVPAPTKETPA